MTSGVPKKYHGGTLRVPWGHQAEAGWVFPLHTTHCYSKTTDAAIIFIISQFLVKPTAAQTLLFTRA